MNTISAIRSRRSIRKFLPDPVSRDTIENILQAGIDAPSAKNRQPWRFVVVTEDGDKAGMLQAMREGLEWMEQNAVQPEQDRRFLQGAWNTLRIMEQAPVTIFILNAEGKTPFEGLESFGERFMEMANVQSIGAAIQNMCLAAKELGLGCLDCPEYVCGKATAGMPPSIHTGTYLADGVTWTIMPYVSMQYGN